MSLTLGTLRRYAIARSLTAPAPLGAAVERLGFVQADPIRAPARAQDLILRHRVKGYAAGDLERRYPQLDVEEDFFINYGFMPRAMQALMHPRTPAAAWSAARHAQANAVLDYVRQHGVVHPAQVDAHFDHGASRNWFGGTSRASTQLLNEMHYRGLVRVAGRAKGVRTYAGCDPVAPDCEAVDGSQLMDRLVDVIVRLYAPLPERSLSELISRLREGAPQWAGQRNAALQRAKRRMGSAVVEGVTWFWPQDESPQASWAAHRSVRLLAPFDPVVWDRRRFEIFWGWAYRFEAYTPARQRVRGYYALPLLWGEQVIGWGNVSVSAGALKVDLGYVGASAPRGAGYERALAVELRRFSRFLGLPSSEGLCVGS